MYIHVSPIQKWLWCLWSLYRQGDNPISNHLFQNHPLELWRQPSKEAPFKNPWHDGLWWPHNPKMGSCKNQIASLLRLSVCFLLFGCFSTSPKWLSYASSRTIHLSQISRKFWDPSNLSWIKISITAEVAFAAVQSGTKRSTGRGYDCIHA